MFLLLLILNFPLRKQPENTPAKQTHLYTELNEHLTFTRYTPRFNTHTLFFFSKIGFFVVEFFFCFASFSAQCFNPNKTTSSERDKTLQQNGTLFLVWTAASPIQFCSGTAFKKRSLSLTNNSNCQKQTRFFLSFFLRRKSLWENAQNLRLQLSQTFENIQTKPNGYFFALQKLLSKKKKVLRKKNKTNE